MKEFWADFIGWTKIQAETKEEAERKFWEQHEKSNFPWGEADQVQIDSVEEVATDE